MTQQNNIEAMLEDIEATRQRISKFTSSDLLRKLKASFSQKSYLEIIGKGRNETSHSSFLAWLLDSHESHNLGCQPMQLLLTILTIRRNSSVEAKKTLPDELCNAIAVGRIQIENITTNTEVYLDKASRADIVAEIQLKEKIEKISTLRLIIENKVFSSEHDEQTERYKKHYDKNKEEEKGIHNIFVYLTPNSDFELESIKSPQCSSSYFIQINYQDLYRNILAPLLKKENINPQIRFMLTDYVINLGVTIDTNKKYNKTDKNSKPLAMTEEQEKLLIDFYENNQDLLIAVLPVIPKYLDLPDEDKNTINKALNIISKNNSTFTYSLEGYMNDQIQNKPQYLREKANKKDVLTKANLVWDIINVYIQVHKGISYQELVEAFPDELTIGSLKTIALVDEAKERDDRYFADVIKLDTSDKVRVCSEWGVSSDPRYSSFDKFKEQAKKLGFTINEV